MKLSRVTNELRASGDKALVAFLTAGFPDEDTFRGLVRAADAAGCNLIEIGIPFSDPIADGPLIQESSLRALRQGMSLSRALDLIAEVSQEIAAPILVMSYYNPVLRMGDEAFASRAASSGVVGAIIPDVPFEESGNLRPVLRSHDLALIDLIAPTSGVKRIADITRHAEGFLYLVSVTGVTGVRAPRESDIGALAAQVKTMTRLPLYAGFGISDSQTARAVADCCDGVIIGSALIRKIKQAASTGEAVERVHRFLVDIKSAMSADTGAASERETS